MKKYIQLPASAVPFDGDVVIYRFSVFDDVSGVFRKVPAACRVSGFRNSCLSATLSDCRGRRRRVCLSIDPDVVRAFRRV